MSKLQDSEIPNVDSGEILYEIRAHHGMCLAFFEGKGYSSGFVRHMSNMKKQLEKNPVVRVINRTDCICEKCPNNQDGQCTSMEKTAEYDRQVLKRCGIPADSALFFRDFQRKIEEHILHAGKREEICGDCQWNALCRAAENAENRDDN